MRESECVWNYLGQNFWKKNFRQSIETLTLLTCVDFWNVPQEFIDDIYRICQFVSTIMIQTAYGKIRYKPAFIVSFLQLLSENYDCIL